jgi:ssRNA-specific RNase YbeY (16S rRNA maturation enzyme)
MLHLLGWDHSTPSERKEMNRLTREALKRSGITLSRTRL